MLNVEHKLMQQVAPNQTYEALPHPHKLGDKLLRSDYIQIFIHLFILFPLLLLLFSFLFFSVHTLIHCLSSLHLTFPPCPLPSHSTYISLYLYPLFPSSSLPSHLQTPLPSVHPSLSFFLSFSLSFFPYFLLTNIPSHSSFILVYLPVSLPISLFFPFLFPFPFSFLPPRNLRACTCQHGR